MQTRTIFFELLMIALSLSIMAPNADADPFLNGRSVRVSELNFYDFGESSGTPEFHSIDLEQTVCDPDQNELESFFETTLGISFTNDSSEDIALRRFRYSVNNAFGTGTTYRSPRLRLGPATLQANGENSFLSILFLTYADGRKQYLGSDTDIPLDLGVRTVKFSFRGRSSTGKRVRFRVRQTVNFAEFDRCE